MPDLVIGSVPHGDRLMGLVSRQTPRLLLLIDEFPVMIAEMAKASHGEAAQFLRWFRTVRTAADTRARFVLGGSTNLIASLDDLGLVDTVNDLCQIRLKPFDPATSADFVATMFDSRGVDLTDSVAPQIQDLVGAPIPYLLAVFLESIFERARTTDGAVTPELVEAAFTDDLLGGGTALVFRHYWSRLKQYYTNEEAAGARALLGIMSRADGTVGRDTLFQVYLQTLGRQASQESNDDFVRLLQKLDNDFYIVEQDGGYTFLSRVLKLWWKRYYGYQER